MDVQMIALIAGTAPPSTAASVRRQPRSFAPRLVGLVAEPSIRERARPASDGRRIGLLSRQIREAMTDIIPGPLTILKWRAYAISGVPA